GVVAGQVPSPARPSAACKLLKRWSGARVRRTLRLRSGQAREAPVPTWAPSNSFNFYFADIKLRLRIGHLQPFHPFSQNLRDDNVSIPFLIGGHDVPPRILCASVPGHILARLRVVVPVLPFGEILGTDLPVLLRMIETFLQPFSLLILADMQIELENGRSVLGEVLFKSVDGLKSLLHLVLGKIAMHAHYEDVFVVGTIEDANHAKTRSRSVHAPEKVVPQLFLGWFFEAGYLTALWIHAGEDMANRAIFAGGIEPL